jgi:hypothetical protein
VRELHVEVTRLQREWETLGVELEIKRRGPRHAEDILEFLRLGMEAATSSEGPGDEARVGGGSQAAGHEAQELPLAEASAKRYLCWLPRGFSRYQVPDPHARADCLWQARSLFSIDRAWEWAAVRQHRCGAAAECVAGPHCAGTVAERGGAAEACL